MKRLRSEPRQIVRRCPDKSADKEGGEEEHIMSNGADETYVKV